MSTDSFGHDTLIRRKRRKKFPGQEHLERELQPEKLENAKNRWEVHKYLAAASRARARAIADSTSFEGSPFTDSSLNRTFDTYQRPAAPKHKKKGIPGSLSFGASLMVLKFAKEAQGEKRDKKKPEKPKKVNGWYVMSPDGGRQDQESPLSWKDILEKPVKELEEMSEYKRHPRERILPSRNHRRINAQQLEEETSEEKIKEKYKSTH